MLSQRSRKTKPKTFYIQIIMLPTTSNSLRRTKQLTCVLWRIRLANKKRRAEDGTTQTHVYRNTYESSKNHGIAWTILKTDTLIFFLSSFNSNILLNDLNKYNWVNWRPSAVNDLVSFVQDYPIITTQHPMKRFSQPKNQSHAHVQYIQSIQQHNEQRKN